MPEINKKITIFFVVFLFQSTDERPSSRIIPHLVTPDQPLLLLQGIGRMVGNARTLGSVALREKQSFQVEPKCVEGHLKSFGSEVWEPEQVQCSGGLLV